MHDTLPLDLATVAKERVQFIEIGDARHRGGEAALHGLDGPLGVGLLVAAGRHAESRIKDIMTRECCVARVELTVASLKDQRSDSSWIIPPDLLGYGVVELEGRDHAFEDGLGAL